MNRDTVIALAREAGLYPHVEWGGMFYVTSGFLENFAALVTAHEREECAKVCDEEANDLSCGEDWNECGGYLARTIRSRT